MSLQIHPPASSLFSPKFYKLKFHAHALKFLSLVMNINFISNAHTTLSMMFLNEFFLLRKFMQN